MNQKILAAGFVLFSVMLPLKATAAQFSRIYVFSDSLSDSGNVLSVTTAAHQFDSSTPITPPPPYFQGRFSNGLNWVDRLSAKLKVDLIPSTQLAVGGPITFTPLGLDVNFNFGGATTTRSVNFAFGGAQTDFLGNADPRLPVGLLREVQSYVNDLQVANTSANSDALYIVWAGPNDYNAGGLRDSTEPINNILLATTLLAQAGARNFLVPNLPDLGKTPRASNQGSGVAAALTQVTQEHNLALSAVFNNLRQTYNDINIIPLDVDALYKNVRENPLKFGLTNVTEACLSVPSCATNPNEQNNYLFWDDLHPTAAGHKIIEQSALKAIGVPEPAATLGILALGVLGVGATLSKEKGKRKKEKLSC